MSVRTIIGSDGVYHVIYGGDNILVNGTARDEDIHFDYLEGGGTGIATIKAGAGKDSITAQKGSLVYGEAGDDEIRGGGDNPDSIRVYGGEGNDTIHWFGNYATVDGGMGNDSMELADYATADGGSGDDLLFIGRHSRISGGDGNDRITMCAFSYADGGNGNDVISVSELSIDNGNVTILGGKGNDTINVGAHSEKAGALLKYHSGDGNDVIYGANCKGDVLEIDTNYTLSYTQDESQKQNNRADLILTMSDGSTVTFKELYVDEYIEHPLQITGGSGGWGSSGYTYSGGSQTISDYTGEKVKWNADFTGLGFNNTDFLLYSSSGALTLQNVRDKVIDVADGNGNTVAYAFMASGGGTIDGSGFSPLEVILGGNNASNVIKAGSGGSSLWGGAGNTADTLSGGGGIDYFFAGKDDGSDVIQNASQNDRVMLYNTALSDIANAGTSSNSISLTFNTGATLVVNDKGGLSPTFQLSDGSCWKFNHSTNNWQSA